MKVSPFSIFTFASALAPHSQSHHFWTFAPLRSHFSSLIHEKCERSGAKVQKWRWCECGAERCGKIPKGETFTVVILIENRLLSQQRRSVTKKTGGINDCNPFFRYFSNIALTIKLTYFNLWPMPSCHT